MAARNPNPTRISDAVWRLWTEFDEHEPTALLGGVFAAKPGYHHYRGALDDDDYSVADLLADRRGSAIKGSAIDLTLSAEAMRRYTTRLDVAARARDPRLYSPRGPVLREFIGTKDSVSVYCYVLVGGRALGVGADAGPDPGRGVSHLWHIHLSIIRQFCEDWDALDGVLSVLKGESLAAWRARTEDPLMALSERDQTTLIWRVEGLVAGRLEVAGGPTKGEPIAVNVKLAALESAASDEKTRDALLRTQLVADLTPALVAALRDLPADLTAEQIEAAVQRVVGQVRLTVAPAVAAPPVA